MLLLLPLLMGNGGAEPAIAAAQSAAAPGCDASPLVIRNVSVWTPDGPLRARDVFMQGGRVASVEPAGASIDKGVRTIDGQGHTLLPGLVDAHLHFSVPGGLPGAPRGDTPTITARQLLLSGVTSGRLHLAGVEEAVALKRRSQDPCALMPALQVGGPGLSGAIEKDFTAFQRAVSVEDARTKIASFGAAGVDWVAVHDAHRFAPGVLDAIGQAAKLARIRVMAQGSSPDEISAVLRIAPDTLDYIDRTAEPGYPQEILDRIRAARDIVLVPTIGVPFRATELRRAPARLDDASHVRFLSPPDAAFVLANARKDLESPGTMQVVAYASTMGHKMRQLRSLGLPMAIGTDAGSTLHFQSNAIWWEMEAWRAAGVPPRDVILAATVNAARVLRWADVGHLRAGARADFVLYRGDVEEGAFDVDRVLTVGRRGIVAQ